MRTTALLALLALLTACKGGSDDSGLADADQDGYAADEDCDDNDETVYPGAEELCDGLDNDCDEIVDDNASDALTWYADADADAYGDASDTVQACEAPSGYIDDATDCDDVNALVHPGATEICNAGVDDDCNGQSDDEDAGVDLSTGLSWWTDADADGFGAGAPTRSCAIPSGGAGNDVDCDDADANTFPGATEICDGLDNSCEGAIDEGLLGLAKECPADSCLALANAGETASGSWWVDPAGGDPFQAYCDLVSDGGGWTLLTWTENSSALRTIGGYEGEPYPGVEVCEALNCSYGSAGTQAHLQAVITNSSEFGSGMSSTSVSVFQSLADYQYASSFDYGDLSVVTLANQGSCNASTAASGTHTVISGPTDYDNVAVYMDLGLRYGSYDYAAGTSIIWSYAEQTACAGSGQMPSVYLGSWTPNNYGPYLSSTMGARSTWVR